MSSFSSVGPAVFSDADIGRTTEWRTGTRKVSGTPFCELKTARFPRSKKTSHNHSRSITYAAKPFRCRGPLASNNVVHTLRNPLVCDHSPHGIPTADTRQHSYLSPQIRRQIGGLVPGPRTRGQSCQAIAGDEDDSLIAGADPARKESTTNGAPFPHETRQNVEPTGRPAVSYYPPEFAFLKELERPDLTPFFWGLAGVVLLLVTRNLIADEMVRWLYWSQVAAKGSLDALNLVLMLAAGSLSRLFPGPMFAVAKFADQVWITCTREYAMMVEILPLWETATSLLLATAVLAVADVAVPDSEKPRLNAALVPASAVALGVVCGKVHPERMLILIGGLTVATLVRWRSMALTSALTAVTPAVFTLVAASDSLLFRLPLILLYVGLAFWQRKRTRPESVGENGTSHKPSVHLPIFLRVAALIWTAVAGRRWAYHSLLKWMAL